jgi:hypothetical protein
MTHGHGAGEQHRPGEQRFGGMQIPEPEFADDDGSPDPRLAEVLALHSLGEARMSDVVRALHGRRLMTPLMAVLDSVDDAAEAGAPGPGEKDSHMATVSLLSPDGRRGLLAFTSVASMAAWDPAARGIPASAQRVAGAALQEGADAVLLDLAGPVRLALQGEALRAVAARRDWVPVEEDPAVRAAVADALADVAGLAGHELLASAPAPDAPDLLVVLTVGPGSDAEAVAGRAAEALAVSPVLVERCPAGIAVGLVDPA